MVLMLVEMKQCQMEFGGDYVVMFIGSLQQTRFQSNWTGVSSMRTKVESEPSQAFSVTMFRSCVFLRDGGWCWGRIRKFIA